MKITRAVVPSLFTVLNMFSGFMSILHASRGEFTPACWFIILAAGFDALDGIMARITKSSSEFGVQIDSLSDVVSFGAAPAFLVHQLDLHRLEGFGVLVSSMLMVFAGLRLARFNVQLVGFDKDHFVGLPVPMSAMTVASFTLDYYSAPEGLQPLAAPFLPWLAAGLSLLMVSKVRYETLPKFSTRGIREHPLKYGLLLLSAVAVVVTRGGAIFPLLVAFIAYGLIRSVIVSVVRLASAGSHEEEAEAGENSRIDT